MLRPSDTATAHSIGRFPLPIHAGPMSCPPATPAPKSHVRLLLNHIALYFNNEAPYLRLPQRVQPEEFRLWLQPCNCEIGRQICKVHAPGVLDTANQAAWTAGTIDRLFNADKEKIERFGRGAASALLVYRYAQANLVFSIKKGAHEMKISFLTASGRS